MLDKKEYKNLVMECNPLKDEIYEIEEELATAEVKQQRYFNRYFCSKEKYLFNKYDNTNYQIKKIHAKYSTIDQIEEIKHPNARLQRLKHQLRLNKSQIDYILLVKGVESNE